MMNILLTGGDDTDVSGLVEEVIEELEREVGGLKKQRGEDAYKIVDLTTEEEDILASEDLEDGPTVGNLHINVDAINDVSKTAIKNAIRKGRLIVIDRISRMEMHSSAFREGVRDAFRGGEDVIAIVDPKYVDEFEEEGKVVRLTEDNREEIKRQLVEELEREEN
ncbi:MAG: nucleoside-triphosphatase [Candidatus Nanohaloarchaea archaeon]|nr:nucleoside-triphosphatase [Candidatus Nanohaloarchaea archaeon]